VSIKLLKKIGVKLLWIVAIVLVLFISWLIAVRLEEEQSREPWGQISGIEEVSK
jgi:hypothetical protein